ncbi:MAG TPA: thiosulfate oxidation carrier protein SoxY [Candidatus Eisenbacteria bacterium]|nr:thiosulfate oxidation carrier protein SoxY [Candidatus Eisenbacteria bacterium]
MLTSVLTGTRSRLSFGWNAAGSLAEIHTPKLIVPAATGNGAHVPIAVKMNHPMEEGHRIVRVEFLNESDPIPSKGVFYPTPANGELFFAFQARMHSGTSAVVAVAECNLHGPWAARRTIAIPEGQGGCATAGNAKQAAEEDAILPPVIRIPELVRRGRLKKGETAEVQVKFKHPSKTGLAYENHRFVKVEDPLYLTLMQVFYGDRLVTRYEMTAGLSDSPFLKFTIKFLEEKPLRILFRNSRGEEFKAVTEVVLS